MTTLPALPPSPAPAVGGLPAGTAPAGSDGGAFAGLLVPGAASAPVAAEPVLGEAVPVLPEDAEGALTPGVEPTAAQIIVAAQVTPVGPMLANAPRLASSYGEAVPGPGAPTSPASSAPAAPPASTASPASYAVPATAPSSATKSSISAAETELFVGHLGVPTDAPDPSGRVVASSAPAEGRVVASSALGTEPVATDTVRGGGSDDSTVIPGRGSDDSAMAGGQQGAGQQASAPATTAPTAAATDAHAGSEPGTPQPIDAPATSQPAHRTETQPGTQPTAAQTSAVNGLTATGTATPASNASAPASTPAANLVAGQVFPEVTRLVSRGDGTRRITLQLSPEALGDVRVVLTVRGGEVQVRMSGGELAQQALLAGAPELHKLLDAAGASTSQIQVGTQSSTTTMDQALDQHAQRQDARNDGEHTQNHRTAGTRDGDTSARDGAPRGTHPHPATNPGTRTRIAGVDVTM